MRQASAPLSIAGRLDPSQRHFLGSLPSEPTLFWHLDRYQTMPQQKLQKAEGTVVKSFGTVWLFTIAVAGRELRQVNGSYDRTASIGPGGAACRRLHGRRVHTRDGVRGHRYPGVEAWHTVSGEMCVETPKGRFIQRPGDLPSSPRGSADGTDRNRRNTRKSLVLILQDASQLGQPPTRLDAEGSVPQLAIRSSHWNLRRTRGRRHRCGWSPAGPASGVGCFINDELPAGPGELRRGGLAIGALLSRAKVATHRSGERWACAYAAISSPGPGLGPPNRPAELQRIQGSGSR